METATKITAEESKAIAAEILNQLGGNKFIVMTGSKNFMCDGPSLRMNLSRNKSKAKWLKITLTSMDDYTMDFFTADKEFNIITKAKREGVTCDILQAVFTEVTGLYTSLGTMGR